MLLACDASARPLVGAPATPWARYLALAGDQLVGGGGFTAPPRAGRVEIGYFTLPDCQRLGHGRATAAALLGIAHLAAPGLQVIAHTARRAGDQADDSASARILWSLGLRPTAAWLNGHAVWRWAATGPAQAIASLRPGRAATMAR